jgi:hypothetical protein
MVVGEPSLMGGEFGDEDERLITRLGMFSTGCCGCNHFLDCIAFHVCKCLIVVVMNCCPNQ